MVIKNKYETVRCSAPKLSTTRRSKPQSKNSKPLSGITAVLSKQLMSGQKTPRVRHQLRDGRLLRSHKL